MKFHPATWRGQHALRIEAESPKEGYQLHQLAYELAQNEDRVVTDDERRIDEAGMSRLDMFRLGDHEEAAIIIPLRQLPEATEPYVPLEFRPLQRTPTHPPATPDPPERSPGDQP